MIVVLTDVAKLI